MLHLITLILMAYTAPPRCPDELLASGLSDRNVRVWLAVRKVQGVNDRAWGKAQYYADVAGKTKSATENALSELRAAGWLEVVGKRVNTPELQCCIPASEALGVSRTVRDSLTHRETPITRIESGQGIRSGESSSENNNNTRAPAGEGKKGPVVLTPEQSAHRRRLAALGVFDAPADRIVTAMEPAWVALVAQAGEHLQRRGKTRDLGALVVAMADGRQPLPAIEAPPAVPVAAAAPAEATIAVRTDADREALSRRNAEMSAEAFAEAIEARAGAPR